MDEEEELARRDSEIKGMWCVPKYSNPSGVVYSPETVQRLASMNTAAEDFRILWDNAYTVHHLGGGPAPLTSILEACKKAGHPDRVLMFGSTSKVSFPGAGIALIAGSTANMDWLRSRLFAQTIGPDKINMLRHVLYFKDMQGILNHMDKHARIIAPKFQAVQEILERELGGKGLATWTRPQGGYFVSLDTKPGCAKAVVTLAGELGVKFTKAGSTWPYGKDPGDSNIRIACTLEDRIQYVSSAGATAGSLLGNTVSFAPLRNLEPKSKAVWRIVARGVRAGDTRFRVTMHTDSLGVPVEQTEATHVYHQYQNGN
jgi:DNA-binding transcriptional MocR family regulator